MTLTSAAQYISDALAIALVIRLLVLRLHAVYRVFCAYVALDLVSSLLFFIVASVGRHRIDYRIVWMSTRPFSWILTLWMVYALLAAMLINLQGILVVSRKVLNISLVIAILIALLTAWPEYSALALAGSADPVQRLLGITLVLERAIFLAALLLLFMILGFILWFPVEMPRNLAVFGIGFVAFFSISMTVYLLHTFWRPAETSGIFNIATVALAACYAYWLTFINRAGERRPVRPGHSWQPAEQQKMIAELERMNAALLRGSHR